MTTPARLQLSRRKGFNLQALSQATNGLPAVNVARPSRFGNPFFTINEEGWPWISDHRDPEMPVLNNEAGELIGVGSCAIDWHNEQAGRVALFRARCVDGLPNLAPLRGKNLACWCKPGAPCHADVLLEMANRPICEAAD